MKRYQGPRRLAQASLGPVPHHRSAHLAGGRKADADRGISIVAVKPLHDHGTAGLGNALRGRQELGPQSQTFDFGSVTLHFARLD